MHVDAHPDHPVQTKVVSYGDGSSAVCLEFRIPQLHGVSDSIVIHRQSAAALIELGEAIAAAGRKLDSEQKQTAIRAQLAEPHRHALADHIVAPDEPCDGTCTPGWTAEQILRNEG